MPSLPFHAIALLDDDCAGTAELTSCAGSLVLLCRSQGRRCSKAPNSYGRLSSVLQHQPGLKTPSLNPLTACMQGIGLPLEEAMKFWRAEFGPKCAGEAFDKKYAYGVRYNYAKEGKRTDYTPYSCMKIIQTPVPKVTPQRHPCHKQAEPMLQPGTVLALLSDACTQWQCCATAVRQYFLLGACHGMQHDAPQNPLSFLFAA